LVKIADWPVRLERGHLLVDGAINGTTIGVMLDTGAQRSLILRSAAERLRLTRQEVRGYRIFGVGGETHVEAAAIDEFRVGELTRRNWRVIVAGERDFGEHVAAILGEDFFYQLDLEFDLAHHAVRLYQSRDCEGVSLAYWATGGASEVAIEPIFEAQPQVILTLQINGQPVQALLDSGAGASVLNKAEAARLGVTPDSPGVAARRSGGGLGGKNVDYWIGPFQSVAIGNETIRDTNIGFAELWRGAAPVPTGSRLPETAGWAPSMLLGADFLNSHRVLIAHSQRKMYFTYEGGPVFQTTGPRGGPPAAEDTKPITEK